jgi:formate dehydrogenase gamma subunit
MLSTAGWGIAMAVATRPSPERGGGSVLRFDGAERVAHWLMAAMFIVLILTGAILYVPQLVELVGRRRLVERVHVDVGLALPLPLIATLAGPWGHALRRDFKRLNRWTADDRRWFARVRRRQPVDDLVIGKFNPGQKLNASFTLGVLLVMLMTGSVMHWEYYWPLSWRTGATFIHESLAYVFLAVVIGHVLMALAHPPALRSMVTGRVTRGWAARHAPSWLEETDGAAHPPEAPADVPALG